MKEQDAGRTYPQHPLVGVGAAVFRGDRVLLIRRGKPPLEREWSLPGGLVDSGEALPDAVRREVREECGISVWVDDLLDLFEYIERDRSGKPRYHYIVFDFKAEYLEGDLEHSSDALDARWVPAGRLEGYRVSPDVRGVVALGMKARLKG